MNIYGSKKRYENKFFFTPVFHCCFWIWDPRSGIQDGLKSGSAIRDKHSRSTTLGFGMFIPDPGSRIWFFFNPVSWIQGWQDPGTASRYKNASIFNLKIWSRANLDFCPSWIPGSKKHRIHTSYPQHCIYWCLKTDEVCTTPYKLKGFDIRFSTSGFFLQNSFPLAPEYAIKAISNFSKKLRRYWQLSVYPPLLRQ